MTNSSTGPRTPSLGNPGHIGFISRSDYGVALDTEAIAKAANDYKHYEIGSKTMRNLPEYDDCKDYTSENIERFTSAEISKLTAIASNDTPPLFNSYNSFKGISQGDFEDLSGIADQLICNLSILIQDNSTYGLQIPSIASRAWDVMLETHRNLRLRYQQSEWNERVVGHAPRMMPDERTNYTAYSQLLDYVLGTMSWWLMGCAQSEYWNKHLIAILAKWAVKLKIVAFDPQTSAAASLDRALEAIESMKAEAEFREKIIKVGGQERDITTFNIEADISSMYFEEKMELRDHLGDIFTTILHALMTQERSGNDPDFFEVRSMIHWSRTQGITNMIMGSRDENISISSVTQHINYAHCALQLLERNTETLQNRHVPVPRPIGPIPYLKVIRSKRWPVRLKAPILDQIDIHNMDDVISLLVPLSLLDGKVARAASLLVDFTNNAAGPRDIIQRVAPPEDDYVSEYVLSTRSWLEENSPRGLARGTDPDVKHLAQSPVRIGLQGAASSDAQQLITKLRFDYDKHVDNMETWDFRAGTVVVQCGTYARTSQAIAALVVIGGLIIPFTVLDRISGVDPFNITMFTWLLSSFVLVVAKSLYVSDWPWYDFLAGRVECTRLSDIADISGIEAQIVLLFFLQRSASSRFVTQGPYNGVFRRRLNIDRKGRRKAKREDSGASLVQTGGFAIDKPIDLWTLMAAGFIVLKVLNAEGEHLVCIDGRNGGWDSARPGRQANWLTCRHFNEAALEKAHGASKKGARNKREVFILEWITFRWTKVLGVFVREARFG